jgi:hypothetical protein
MAKTLVIGIVYAHELGRDDGHVACTLGGVNYESRSSRGIVKGRDARGATSRLFRHRFYLVLSDTAALRAKRWADAQVGEPYVWGRVPGHGGDCSGYVSGIICTALNRPVRRLFSTETWTTVYRRLGFKPGTGPSPAPHERKDDMTPSEFLKLLKHPDVWRYMGAVPWTYIGRGIADNDLTPEDNKSTLWMLDNTWRNAVLAVEKLNVLAAALTDEKADREAMKAKLAELDRAATERGEQVRQLRENTPQATVDMLLNTAGGPSDLVTILKSGMSEDQWNDFKTAVAAA